MTKHKDDTEAAFQEAKPQETRRQERKARQQRLQSAKAGLEARVALQGRITGVVVALVLIGAIALSVHECGRQQSSTHNRATVVKP